MSTTEADREKAREILRVAAEANEWLVSDEDARVEAVAAALAAEREKARAPFRRLALDVKDGWQPSADRLADAILTYTGGYDDEGGQ